MAKTRSQDNTAPNPEALIQERNKLIVSGKDPKRLAEIRSKLDYFYYGLTR